MGEIAGDLTNPGSLWSLWVPFTLYLFILLAAIYFARIKIK
jgi:hypothetical protein